MTSPQNAFSPGSPANGIAQSAMTAALGGGLSGMQIPSVSSSAESSARSGDAYQTAGNDGSGFSVNFGNGVSQGSAAMPSMVWLLAIGIAGLWAWKRYN